MADSIAHQTSYPVYPEPQGNPGNPGYPQANPSNPGYPQANPGNPGYPSNPGYPQGYPQQIGQGFPAAAPAATNSSTSINMGPEDAGLLFSDKSIRRAFIRKVYGLLALQLALTSGIIGLFYIEDFRTWNQQHPGLLIAASIATFVLIIVLACVPNLRRKAPQNLILLLIFTACEGLLLGSICAYYSQYGNTDAVIKAAVATVAIFVGLTLFAFQTKIDFTMMAGAMFTLLWGLIIFGFMCLIFQSELLYNVYAALGAILFSMYIIIDTQLLIGGKHKYSVSPEEYIFAALSLYCDIINLFLFLLRILGDN